MINVTTGRKIKARRQNKKYFDILVNDARGNLKIHVILAKAQQMHFMLGIAVFIYLYIHARQQNPNGFVYGDHHRA